MCAKSATRHLREPLCEKGVGFRVEKSLGFRVQSSELRKGIESDLARDRQLRELMPSCGRRWRKATLRVRPQPNLGVYDIYYLLLLIRTPKEEKKT